LLEENIDDQEILYMTDWHQFGSNIHHNGETKAI